MKGDEIKMKTKIVRVESPYMLDVYARYMKEKKVKKIRLGEFLWWLFHETKQKNN